MNQGIMRNKCVFTIVYTSVLSMGMKQERAEGLTRYTATHDLLMYSVPRTMLWWGIENFVIPHPRIFGSVENLMNTSTCRLRWLCQTSFGCADTITDAQTFRYVSATETSRIDNFNFQLRWFIRSYTYYAVWWSHFQAIHCLWTGKSKDPWSLFRRTFTHVVVMGNLKR